MLAALQSSTRSSLAVRAPSQDSQGSTAAQMVRMQATNSTANPLSCPAAMLEMARLERQETTVKNPLYDEP